MNELIKEMPEEALNLIKSITKTGAYPYSETKKGLDAATKKTVKALSPRKQKRPNFPWVN